MNRIHQIQEITSLITPLLLRLSTRVRPYQSFENTISWPGIAQPWHRNLLLHFLGRFQAVRTSWKQPFNPAARIISSPSWTSHQLQLADRAIKKKLRTLPSPSSSSSSFRGSWTTEVGPPRGWTPFCSRYPYAQKDVYDGDFTTCLLNHCRRAWWVVDVCFRTF